MKKKLLMALAVVILSLLSIQNFAQAPVLGTAADYASFMALAPTLGTAADFVLFTAVGAVGDTPISQITGNVGTNSGAITGFGNVNGVMHTSDGASGQCAADLLIAYNQLNSTIPTFFPAPLLGNGQVFNAGVYKVTGASTLNNELILDAQNDPNAVFIIQIEGTFSTAANSKVTLANQAMACNVFWKIEGLVDMASGTTMRGTVIANNAAINMNAGGILEGRALSTGGAVNVSGVLAYTPIGCGSPVLMGPAAPDLVSAACYAIFSGNGPVTNAGISYVTGDVGTNVGLTTGFNPLFVTGMIHPIPDGSTAAAAADLLNAYNYLSSIPFDIELLYPAQFGHNLVLTPHTYLLNAATSLTDTLYLNGGGQEDAIFVIKIFGALNTSNYSKVVLTNGTLPGNVFWVVEGAVNITDYSIFKGTVIANNGAVELGTGANIDGRAFTTTGAIGTAAVTVTMPPGCGSALPPAIVTGPENQTVCEGDMVSFTVSATGDGLEYQWRKGTVDLIDGLNIFGSTTDSLTINPVLLSDAALDYNVVVTGTYLPAATSENVSLIVQALPVIEPMADTTICENDQQYIIDVIASNYSSLTWTTTGTGTFNPLDIEDVSYSPSAEDILSGFVELCVTANPEAPCIGSVTECFVLTFQKAPAVYAGADATIPTGMDYTFDDATAANYSSLLWTGGLGIFDDDALLDATYTPALGDNGTVMFVLTAQAINPCTLAASDNVYITYQEGPMVYAGSDETICDGSSYQLAGTAQFVSSVLWSGGLGTFDDPTLLSAIYTPAVGEIGSVTLTLTGYPIIPSADPVTDVMVLTLQNAPVVYAGADAIITRGMSYTFADATATNYSSLLWTGGLGTFDDATMLNATYTPALGDNGSVMLVLTAQPVDPCTMPVSDNVNVTIQEIAIVDAGADAVVCEGSSYQLAGTAQFVSSVEWSGGLGSFNDPTLLSAIYTPAVGEIEPVTLTLTGYPIIPSADPVTDAMVLTIQAQPVVNAGTDMTVCDNVLTIQLTGTASNNSGIMWHGGNGFFDDDVSLTTFYNVDAADIAAGSVTLCLTATPIAPCQGSSVDCITITFDPSPTISNLQDATICDDVVSYCFTGVSATNYSSLLWTGGDGAFDNATTLNPCYTPGAADVLASEVILTLTAQPIGACNIPAVESMTLYIVGDPTIELDAEIYLTCANYDFELEQWLPIGLAPIVTNAPSVLWTTTSVDGFFDNPAAALTSYNVGMSDKWNGSVTLTLTAYGDENCGGVAEASIIIYIPQQIIEVLPGTVWRGISSYVDKSTTSVAAVMDPVVVVPGSQSLVIMHIQNGKYFWPAVVPAVNQLGLWQPVGYKARFKAEGCLPIYGDVAYDTVGHNLAVSGAITYVPCLTNYPVAINDLFDGFENQILLIYSWEEGTMWVPDPNVVGPLNFIRPGSAYMMVNKAGANYSVTFPSFDFNAATVSKAVVPAAGTDYVTPWNTPANTAQPHFILFADEVISSMQAGDIVGAFDRYDECVGTTEIGVKTDLNKLLAMGDDPSTEAIDGYQDGENMTFKLYRPSTDETFDVTFTYDANYPSYDNKFAIYGVSNATGMTTTLTSVNELVVDRSINVYPNPAKEVINITSDYDLRKVTLVNYVGQTVFSQVVDGNNFQINVSNFVNGMYFVRIETVQGNVVTKPISIQ